MPPDLRALLQQTADDVRELPDVPAITRRGRIFAWRRRGLRLTMASAVVLAVLFGGSQIELFESAPTPPAEQAPRPVTPLESSSSLETGVYGVNDFVTPFTLQIDTDGWFAGTVTPTWVYVARKGFNVHVQQWESVVTDRGPTPLPEDVAAWLESHPGLRVVRSQSTTIGGFPATMLDFRARQESTRSHPECPTARCLIFARVAESGEAIDVVSTETTRLYVVETPTPVFIYWHAPTRRFGDLEGVLDPVARSIRFL
jgi:hypothetical protein